MRSGIRRSVPVPFQIAFAVYSTSGPDLPRSQHDPLAAGEAFESDRSPRMELVGRDADLGAEPVLEAVGEAGRRIDQHRARVDFAKETHRVSIVLRDDRVRVLRAVLRDMLDRIGERIDDAYRKDAAALFGVPAILEGLLF